MSDNTVVVREEPGVDVTLFPELWNPTICALVKGAQRQRDQERRDKADAIKARLELLEAAVRTKLGSDLLAYVSWPNDPTDLRVFCSLELPECARIEMHWIAEVSPDGSQRVTGWRLDKLNCSEGLFRFRVARRGYSDSLHTGFDDVGQAILHAWEVERPTPEPNGDDTPEDDIPF